MTRPAPTVLLEQEDELGNYWQILEGEETYLVTYKGQPVSVRVLSPNLGFDRKAYKRMSYTELGTCMAQVRRYNQKFNTKDFAYIRVFSSLNVNHN
jgi:hypothetical protein